MPKFGAHWERLRRYVLNRDDYRCVKCLRRGQRLEVDHIIPRADGGAAHDPDNLQTLCRDCHIAKTRAETRDGEIAGQAEWERELL